MAKILLLDDDEETLVWVKAALESRGHAVSGFRSGKEALAALETFTPDLIVADIMMPELDGLGFARLVRSYKAIPLMIVSIAKKEAEAVLSGAVSYVQKPATASEIRAAVTRVLGEGARRNTILVVDDDEDIRESFGELLESDFNVLTADSGRSALEVLGTQRVDLAIIDVHMPLMNGAELLRAIRGDPRLEHLPVVVQTSDLAALNAPIWGALRASQVLNKVKFLDWFESMMRTSPLPLPQRAPAPRATRNPGPNS